MSGNPEGESARGSRIRRAFSNFGVALLSAALLAGYALNPALAFLPYVALVPWVVLYSDPKRPRVSHLHYVVTAFVAWLVLYKQAFRFGWYAGPGMGLFFGAVWWTFTPLFRPIHARFRLPRTLTVPLVWVTVEWLRNEFTLGHFDLFALGYSQGRFPVMIQIADVTGVYGVSFLVAAVNGLLADAYFVWRGAGGSFRELAGDRRLVRSAAAVVAAFALAIAYGGVRLATARSEPGPRLAVIQPNIAHTNRNVIGVHLTQVLLTERSVPESAADLIVWPENAILDDIRRPGAYLDDIRWLAERKGAWMLLGANGTRAGRPGKTTNTALLLDSEGNVRGSYEKQLLFPWSEFVPFDDFLQRFAPAAQRVQRTLVRKGWGFLATGLPGEGMSILRLPWNGREIPFAALICVENAYPPIPAEAGRRGARFFVNLTSEGQVAGVIQEQLLRVCMLRAVENRIAYVRCGNTGISGIIDPEGRVRSILRSPAGGTISVAGSLVDRVPLSPPGVTLYARSRDAFARACVLAVVALLLAAVVRGRRSRARAGAALLALAGLSGVGCSGPAALGDDASIAPQALARGKAFVQRGLPRPALRAFGRACADPVPCREALAPAAEAFRSIGNAEDAVDYYAAVEARYPELASEARPFRALFLDRAGDLPAAEAEMARAVSDAPTPENWIALGEFRSRLGREDALDALREAMRLSPEDPRSRYQLAKGLWRFDHRDEARSLLDGHLDAMGTPPAAWALLGMVQLVDGDEANAEGSLRKAIDLDPANLQARHMLARIAMQQGRLDDAERLRKEILGIEATLGRGLRND